MTTSVPEIGTPRVGARRLSRLPVVVFLAAFLMLTAGPLVYAIVASLRGTGASGWTFANWREIFDKLPLLTGLRNSAILAAGSAVVIVVVSASAGFAFAKLPFRGSKAVLVIIVLTLTLPLISAIAPEYLNLAKYHLIGSFAPTILVYAAFNAAFAVVFFTNYFNSIPDAYVENAITEGAGYLTIFLRIMVPMAVPALLTIGVFDFMLVWNDLLVALLFMPQSDHQTLAVLLASLTSSRHLHTGAVLAGALFSTIPNAIVFLSCQRYLVLGFSLGVDK